VPASDLKVSNLVDLHHFACSPAAPVVEGSNAVKATRGAVDGRRKAQVVNAQQWALKRLQAVSAHGR
jgi:hypothetical protein